MSLVGSLEDLSLGDILQIISLSRKSGLLQLRSEEGEGRIVFCDGLVRAGFVKGEVEDLKGLLVVGGFIAEAAYDKAAMIAAAHGDAVAEVLASTSAISLERIDSLRREQVERSVFRMFSWTAGEFSFEVSDTIDDRDRDLLVSAGINAQYLTMEATRIGDEGGTGNDDDIQFGTVDDECGADSVETELATESAVEEHRDRRRARDGGGRTQPKRMTRTKRTTGTASVTSPPRPRRLIGRSTWSRMSRSTIHCRSRRSPSRSFRWSRLRP